jgi:hypothetical protein
VVAKLAVVFLGLAAAAQSPKEGGLRPAPASAYPSRQVTGKLAAAAVRYESDADAKAVFGGTNPNEYGVLPVLLVLENKGDSSLLLDRMKVELQLGRRRPIEPTPAQDLPYLIAAKRPDQNRRTPIVPFGLPKKGNPLAHVEFDQRKFAAKSLIANDNAFGFYYFQTRYTRDAMLVVSGIRDGASGKELFFMEIPLDPPQAR